MYKEVKRAKTTDQALASLMEICAKAERSTGDARRLMYRWGVVDKAEQERVVEQLVKDRFIDDSRYARAYVREKTNLCGWGGHKIRAALVAKSISHDIIGEALSQIEPQGAKERLLTMMTRKLRTVKGENDYQRKGKLIRYGLSLGYDYEAVTDVAERIIEKIED